MPSPPVNRDDLSSDSVAAGGVAGPASQHTIPMVGDTLGELHRLRESVLRLAGLVESQIDDTLTALRTFDRQGADRVRMNDQVLNELFREIREQVMSMIAARRPEARELRSVFFNDTATT